MNMRQDKRKSPPTSGEPKERKRTMKLYQVDNELSSNEKLRAANIELTAKLAAKEIVIVGLLEEIKTLKKEAIFQEERAVEAETKLQLLEGMKNE